MRAIIADILSTKGEATGYSSLAPGADQLFAEEVLAAACPLVFVQPVFPDGEAHYAGVDFERQARETIPAYGPTPDEAYLAAGRTVADLADMMIFVWDGGPARGIGGTADIVAYAESLGKSAMVLDPVLKESSRIGRPPVSIGSDPTAQGPA